MPSTPINYADLRTLSSSQVRAEIRSGRYARHTAGLSAGKLQCNLAILPEAVALDFLRFCQRNPKPCPVVGVSDTGNPFLPTLGHDIDIRTDVPRYRIFRDGKFTDEVTDIAALWRDDLVTVALGCSFTFENALIANNIPVRHIEQDKTVPMYRTDIALTPAGVFAGEMVATMRPIHKSRVEDAYTISAAFPHAHGAPIAFGDPAQIGISDLNAPDWGDPIEIRDDEIPVYWACGVTPQNVLLNAKLPMCITHAPGHMLIADVSETLEDQQFLQKTDLNKETIHA
ncbi:putative hydro-lyase [Litoreibacter sp.]|nr:putative hydro-lyase [Litoreibacter sp.]